jgi:MYXO-CTERM domain-containing protein
MGDVDGDGRADLCVRGDTGMTCALSDGAGFGAEIAGPAWSDDAGFTEVGAWSTIRLVDLDHDGRADLCARTPAGIECARSLGASFGPVFLGPGWSDDTGWADFDNASTVRYGDVDGDGDEDVCARANLGWRCFLYEAESFPVKVETTLFADGEGWNAPGTFPTIDLADVDGDGALDTCGRGADGVECWLWDGATFGIAVAGPAWSDDAGWDDPIYRGTMRLSGVYDPPPPVTTTGTTPSVDTTGTTPSGGGPAATGTDPVTTSDPRVVVTPPPGGCGCATGSAAGGAWVLVLAIAMRRRR